LIKCTWSWFVLDWKVAWSLHTCFPSRWTLCCLTKCSSENWAMCITEAVTWLGRHLEDLRRPLYVTRGLFNCVQTMLLPMVSRWFQKYDLWSLDFGHSWVLLPLVFVRDGGTFGLQFSFNWGLDGLNRHAGVSTYTCCMSFDTRRPILIPS
jgi:hypothetical protein